MEKIEGYKKTAVGWNWASIGKLCELKTGATPSRKKTKYWDNGTINWLASGEVHKRYIYDVESKITFEGHHNSNTHILPVNTIVIALNGQGKTRGKVAVVKTETTCNQSLGAFICQNELNHMFLFFYLESQYQNIRDLTGEGRNGLNLSILRKIKIPVPPLPEQKKIADILTTVDDKISSIDNKIQQTEKLKKGLMEKLLTEGIGHTEFKETEIGRIPKDWKFTNIEKACLIRNNLRKPISVNERKKMRGEYPYYGPTKIVDYINEYRVEGEYALIGEDGDHFLKYKTRSMTQLASGKFNVNNHAHIIKGKDECSTKWVYHFYKHRNIIPFLTRQGAGRYKLNKASLMRMPIAIPSPKEQCDIIRILSSVDDKLDILTQKKSRYQTLKKGLSQQLLTGQMRVKV